MLYVYKATTAEGQPSNGTIDAGSVDAAISSLQRRGLIIVTIDAAGAKKTLFNLDISFFSRVSQNEVVILSRQLATLFEAKVSVLDAFKLLAGESDNKTLQQVLTEMVDDIQGGVPISAAMAKHSDVFSSFYVSMVRSGEETGKLAETLSYLADYLERNYDLVSKVRNALIYPAFVIASFAVVMIVMLVVVIPQLTAVFKETGQALPLSTQFLIGLSDLLRNFGIYIAVLVVIAVLFLIRFSRTEPGRQVLSRLKLGVPYIGNLYRKLYLARMADNMDTMLSSGISMIRAIEITADVVENRVYAGILRDAATSVKGGASFSDAISRHPEIPAMVVQMSRIGEETGKLGYTLRAIGRFYKRETDNAVQNIVSLIEPFMIVFLGIGVGFLLISIIGPIYDIGSAL